ncbi:uncharacterized protein P174DRAFT_107 [Aspergillus novofumigatus IBT 16806]|uniref:Uncharacterized protein n=1 Tax=Aspergillus novofumigatus (strain IBT 16806) TaxID=1392255 RepID=A0A2I1CJS4_ASPN1|nr:uncharacterized protein P174DRAFT_107 [Aspergillus novofumigatus IBT 16806]PKX97874.1 hypothetical protein P174DRAFT_107 [Aspergillus novofumigatus IBT 16806]
MGSIYQAPEHLQICWSATDNVGQPLSVMLAKDEDRHRDRKDYQAIYQSTPRPGCDCSQETLSPHLILAD